MDIPWSALCLLSGGGALAASGRRVDRRHQQLIAQLLLLAAAIIAVAADGGLSLLAATVALVVGLVIVTAQAGEDGVEQRTTGLPLIACAGMILTAGTDAVPVMCLGVLAVSIGLHAAVVDASPPLRGPVRSSLVFHIGALLLMLLGSVILCGAAGATTVTALRQAAAQFDLAAAPRGPVVLAEVSLVIGACGFAGAFAIRWTGGVISECCPASVIPLLVLPPLTGGLLLVRLLPLLAAMSSESEVAPLIAMCLMIGWGGLLVWRERRLRGLLTGLTVLLFGIWLLGIAAAGWNDGHWQQSPHAPSGLPDGSAAALACMTADVLALVGMIAVSANLGRGDHRIEHFDDLAGLIRQQPVAAIALLLCLLSLCGVPPLPGFWGRWFLLIAAGLPHHTSEFTGLYDPHLGFLAGGLLVLIAQLIAASTILRAVQSLVLDEPLGRVQLRSQFWEAWMGWLLCGTLVAVGVWPAAWIRCTMEWTAPPDVIVRPVAASVADQRDRPETPFAPPDATLAEPKP